jgi:hypothetical protein
MATANLKVRTGNKITVKIDGKDVGLIQSIRSTDNYGLEPAYTIGEIDAQEYVPTLEVHSLSVQTLVLYTGSLLQAGVTIKDGQNALEGLIFDIIITDKQDNKVRTYTGCSYDSGEIEISTNKIVSASCQFKAIGVSSGNAWA